MVRGEDKTAKRLHKYLFVKPINQHHHKINTWSKFLRGKPVYELNQLYERWMKIPDDETGQHEQWREIIVLLKEHAHTHELQLLPVDGLLYLKHNRRVVGIVRPGQEPTLEFPGINSRELDAFYHQIHPGWWSTCFELAAHIDTEQLDAIQQLNETQFSVYANLVWVNKIQLTPQKIKGLRNL